MHNSQAHTIWHAVAFAVWLPALILTFAACSDGEEGAVENQTAQTQTSVQTNGSSSDVETTLSETDQELEQIGQRVENAGDDAATEMEDELDDLRQWRDNLQTGVDSLATKGGEEAREMKEELQGRMNRYKRDLRTVRLKSIESREEFVKAARTEMQEIDERVEQMQQGLSQMDPTRISGHEDTLSELEDEREEMETNLQDVMNSGSEEFADARAAMAEDIAALQSEVDQAFDDVKGLDPRPKAAGTGGGE